MSTNETLDALHQSLTDFFNSAVIDKEEKWRRYFLEKVMNLIEQSGLVIATGKCYDHPKFSIDQPEVNDEASDFGGFLVRFKIFSSLERILRFPLLAYHFACSPCGSTFRNWLCKFVSERC